MTSSLLTNINTLSFFFCDRNFGRKNSWLPRLLYPTWKVAKKCNCKIFLCSKICLIFHFSFLIWSVEKRYFNQSYCEKCEENMSLEQPPFHSHFQEGHFATSFTALDQLRKEDVLTDITLVAAENLSCLPVRTVRAHKLVLMAVSDYFRTMFKGEYSLLERLVFFGSKMSFVMSNFALKKSHWGLNFVNTNLFVTSKNEFSNSRI